MEVSSQVKAKPPGLAKKAEKKEQESTTPDVSAVSQPVEKTELKEVEREASTLLEAARILLPFLNLILSLFFSVHSLLNQLGKFSAICVTFVTMFFAVS